MHWRVLEFPTDQADSLGPESVDGSGSGGLLAQILPVVHIVAFAVFVLAIGAG